MLDNLILTSQQKVALDHALEFYIRMGLGQVGELGVRLSLLAQKRGIDILSLQQKFNVIEEELLKGKGWRLEDKETSINTILAFAIQAQLQENHKAYEWAAKRVCELRAEKP